MEPLVEFDRVDKVYRLGAERVNVRAAFPGRLGRTPPTDGHAALSNISLRLEPGESLGIVGQNGAGKSTLLKIVARVVAPSRGAVVTRGTVASLIELGAGFHPDLTGSENVRFAAVLLGMDRYEIARRYDEIVDFAGIEKFMDTPVKRYSSGMLARLGFAVASHLSAHVLAVDEVLSVGDAEFQSRCFERMKALRASGCALLFVTHNLWVVPHICERAIRLEHGHIADQGDPEEVVNRYRAASLRPQDRLEAADLPAASIEGLSVSPTGIHVGDDVRISATIKVREESEVSRLLLGIERSDGLVCAGIEVPGSTEALAADGTLEVAGTLSSLLLQPGRYRVWLSVLEERAGPVVHDQARAELVVIGQPPLYSMYGVMSVHSDWTITRGCAADEPASGAGA